MNLQVGVKALIRDDQGKYLFLRRVPLFKPGAQEWDIPGGRIEHDEALVDALRREVKEETGLVLEGDVRLLAAQDIFVEGKNLHVVRLTYIGSTVGRKVILSNEHDAYRWMTKDELIAQNVDPYLLAIKGMF